MPYETRTRSIPLQIGPSIVRNLKSGATYTGSVGTMYTGSQSTYSWRTSGLAREQLASDMRSTAEIRGSIFHEYRTRFDNGHEFWTERTEYDSSHHLINILSFDKTYEYVGPLAVSFSGYSFTPPISPPSSAAKANDGARAVAATIPTKAEAALAQFLGELHEGLPRIAGLEFLTHPGSRALGKEYLNEQFGWAPFINDIQKAAQAVSHASKILAQFSRDASSDRIIRRRMQLRDTTSSSFLASAYLNINLLNPVAVPTIWTQFLGSSQKTKTAQSTDTVRQRAWFSGAYTYHLAEAISFTEKAESFGRKADKLLGTSLTPELVWELTPWSWLLDWKLHFGRFLSNARLLQSDELVMRYGYVMHETSVTRQAVATTPVVTRYGADLGRPVLFAERIRKERMRASPYGFGVDSSSFNPRQWAILGALGMTKSPSTLNVE